MVGPLRRPSAAAITGFACPICYRRELSRSAKNAIMVGLAPLLGGLILAWVFIKSCIDAGKLLHRSPVPVLVVRVPEA
jgi:hypothetical protein